MGRGRSIPSLCHGAFIGDNLVKGSNCVSASEESTNEFEARDRRVTELLVLFATLYFIQGISEPSEGLISQPTRSLLRNWGYDTAAVSSFMGALVIPWSIKPLYGLFTDFVPLFGTRRRSWLLVTSLAAAIGLVVIYAFTPPSNMVGLFFLMMLVPTVGVAFSDVVIDALMIEEGQPRGITGRLQGVQWTAIYGATILTGFLGGYLSQRGWQRLGYLIAGLAMALSFVVVLVMVRERHPEASEAPIGSRHERVTVALRSLVKGLSQPGILAIGAFIFLWNFNPFSTTTLYMHVVEHMKFSEQFAGNMVSVLALGAMVGSALYVAYCRRLTVRQLLWLSIVMGVLATVSYWAMVDERPALVISFVVGFVYMTGMIVQLDLAARLCDIKTAGTTFALLMSLSNFAVGSSTAVGGHLYDWLAGGEHYTYAFQMLVGIGALFTCSCAFLVPTIVRYGERSVPQKSDLLKKDSEEH
jgi:Na+/melibiose symporter-like transporter